MKDFWIKYWLILQLLESPYSVQVQWVKWVRVVHNNVIVGHIGEDALMFLIR